VPLTVSVIVPTHFRADHLERALASVRHQLGDGDELLAGVDPDDAAAHDIAKEAGARLVVVDRPGVVAKMNALARAARTDLVVSLDDDATARPGWLDRIRTAFENDPALGGYGGRDVLPWDDPADRTPYVGVIRWFGRVDGNHHRGTGTVRDVHVLKGVNMAFRRDLYVISDRLSRGDTEAHWELDVSLRVLAAGWRVRYDPDLVVDHHVAERPTRPHRLDAAALAWESARNETAIVRAHRPGAAYAVLAWGLLVGAANAYGVAWAARAYRRGDKRPWVVLGRSARGHLDGWRLAAGLRETRVPRR
jgi:GT2 family glycosyltransferase